MIEISRHREYPGVLDRWGWLIDQSPLFSYENLLALRTMVAPQKAILFCPDAVGCCSCCTTNRWKHIRMHEHSPSPPVSKACADSCMQTLTDTHRFVHAQIAYVCSAPVCAHAHPVDCMGAAMGANVTSSNAEPFQPFGVTRLAQHPFNRMPLQGTVCDAGTLIARPTHTCSRRRRYSEGRSSCGKTEDMMRQCDMMSRPGNGTRTPPPLG